MQALSRCHKNTEALRQVWTIAAVGCIFFCAVCRVAAQDNAISFDSTKANIEERGSSFLNQLSDDELLDLYVSSYQDSLRRQVADKAGLVNRGRLVLQAGYSYSYDRDDLDFSFSQHTVPNFIMRYRVARPLELRLGWPGVTFDEVTDEIFGTTIRDTSFANPTVGMRLALCNEKKWFPRTAVTVSSPVDLDDKIQTPDRFNPLVSLSYSRSLKNTWLVSGSSGLVWTRVADQRFWDYQQSVSLDYFLNDYLGLYVEWFGLFPEGARINGMRQLVGPGATISITRDWQFGFSTSFGLNDRSPDLLTQFTVSWRI